MRGELYVCRRCGKSRFVPDELNVGIGDIPKHWFKTPDGDYICDRCSEIYHSAMDAFYSNKDFAMHTSEHTYKSIIEEVNTNGSEQAPEEFDPADYDDPFAAVLKQFNRAPSV